MTIIEVLVAIMLLSVVVLVVLTPLTGFFGLTRKSGTQVSATQAAQQAMEQIRGDWLNQTAYEQLCTASSLPVTTPPLSVNVTNMGPERNVLGTAELRAGACGGTPITADTSPMREVLVRQLGPGGQVASEVRMVVARP